MNKYANGKIYKIISDSSDDVYVGSTCEKYLSNRLAKHRCGYNDYLKGKITNFCTSYKILETDDYDIVLLENYPCDNKDELHARERWYIQNTENIVNKMHPGRTKKEYYRDNFQKFVVHSKEYREKNRDKLNEYLKQYRRVNKKELQAKQNIKHHCKCGGQYTNSNLQKHSKVQKHINYVEKARRAEEAKEKLQTYQSFCEWKDTKDWIKDQMNDITAKLKQIALDKAKYCNLKY